MFSYPFSVKRLQRRPETELICSLTGLVNPLIISPALWVQLVSQPSASVSQVETLRHSSQGVLVFGIVNNLQPVCILICKDWI